MLKYKRLTEAFSRLVSIVISYSSFIKKYADPCLAAKLL